MKSVQNMLAVTALVVALSFSQSAEAATPDAQVTVIQGLASHWGLPLGTDVCKTTWLLCSTDGAVTELLLPRRELNGSIPENLGDLTSLNRLDLSSNSLTGRIPESLGNMTKLSYMYVHGNHLTGSIPNSLGALSNLESLYLNGNNLTGSIPNSLGSLSNLKYLYLNQNNLTGSIPNNLGALSNLNYLSLHSNSLTGSIPESLGYLTRLLFLYLDNNYLSGSIPKFQNKPPYLTTSNNCLADSQEVQRPKIQCPVPTPVPAPDFALSPPSPVIVPTPPQPDPVPGVTTPPLAPSGSAGQASTPSRGWVWAVVAVFVVVVIVAVAIAAVCLASRRNTNVPPAGSGATPTSGAAPLLDTAPSPDPKEPKESPTEREPLEFVENLTNYTTQDLCSMTNSWSEEKLLGRGGFGSVYKCVDSKGRLVAVKRLKREAISNNRDHFMNEVKMLSSVRHRNLVSLHGYCYHQGESILVMCFVDNKSLADHLFVKKENEVPILQWSTRRNILLTSAEALRYLHSMTIIHRDFKPQNILLDSSFNSVVCDFGLARHSEQGTMTTSVGGTVGYMAPDITVTDKVDVYSFGVVLLEMVTGASCRCRYSLGGNHSDSMSVDDAAWLVCTSQPQALLQLIDKAIANEVPDGEAISMLRLAVLCIDKEPSNRPTMEKVVAMLNGYLEVPPLPPQQRHWLGSGMDGSSFSMSTSTISTRVSNWTHRHSMAQDKL